MQNESTLDDVIYYYLVERETNKNALEKVIGEYPQYEEKIKEYAAFSKVLDALPERELTQEEESRAVAIGRSVVKGMLTGQRMGWNEALEYAAKWIENSLSGETNDRTAEFGRNMAMSLRAAIKRAE